MDAAKSLKSPPHLIYISIVGANSVSFSYFQDELKAEKIVVDSGLPWTLQLATQFFDYILGGAKGLTRWPIVPVPKDFKFRRLT